MKEDYKLQVGEGTTTVNFSSDLSILKEDGAFTFEAGAKEVILIYLTAMLKGEINKDPESLAIPILKEIIFFINTEIESITATTLGDEGFNLSVTTTEIAREDAIERIDHYSKGLYLKTAVAILLKKEESLIGAFRKRAIEAEKREKKLEAEIKALKKEKKAERLHKQPRGYLKTTAKLVGRSTNEKTLFSLPEADAMPEIGGNLLRGVMSRNTAILGNYLLQLWQQNGKEKLIINNLSFISEMMGNSNYEIKIYLLYLGGYVYPIIDKDKDGLTLKTEQLFNVEFKYGKKVADKYYDGNVTKIGVGNAKFIKDEPIDSITIKPSPLFIKALEGKGLGNVLVVNDTFIKLALSLTDIAYKIFNYSASNKPSQKIGEDNLVKHLGLEVQIKKQGRPRIRATILKGLQELKDKGHIKSYSYDDIKGMYVFIFSDKYVKHPDHKKSKKLDL
jgi:hypothetical protein